MEKTKLYYHYLTYLAKQPKGIAYRKPEPTSTVQILQALKKKYEGCTQCPLATQGRTQVVFGHGNPHAKIMFVGEGPGRDEDLQGKPFVGRAGQLLTKIILAMGLTREEVYITNVVKCRPPNNRAPLPHESAICKKNILLVEIDAINPRVICTLGATATQELLNKPISITRIRGTLIPYRNTVIMPTFHPAFLLRNPAKKKEVWHDMKKILSYLQTN